MKGPKLKKAGEAVAMEAIVSRYLGEFSLPCDDDFEELGSYFRRRNLSLVFVIEWLYENLQQRKLKPHELKILNAWLLRDLAHPCLAVLGTGKEAPALKKLFALVDRMAIRNKVISKREVPSIAFENLFEPYFNYNSKKCIELIASARARSKSPATKKLCAEMLKSFEDATKFVNEVEAGLKGKS